MKKCCWMLITCGLLNGLTACSLLSPVTIEPTQHFTLEHHSHSDMAVHQTDKTILVMRPKAAAGYDSQSMLYRARAFQVDAFAHNEWLAPPAQLLSSTLERALIQSNAYRAVESASFTGDTDYSVDTTLQRLDQDLTQTPHKVVLELTAQVIDNRTRQVIASELFSISIPMSQNTPYGGVLAANAATDKLTKAVCAFVVKHTHP